MTFWNVEVLEAQDIMHQSLGNCCGFAQVVQRQGLLTLTREKHISRLFRLNGIKHSPSC